MPDASDLLGHVKQRVGDLTGDHVDFINLRHGDYQIGIHRAGLLQHVRMPGMADQSTDVQRVSRSRDQSRVNVDNGDVSVEARQVTGNVGTDLTSTTNNHAHDLPDLTGGEAKVLLWFLRLFHRPRRFRSGPARVASGATRTAPSPRTLLSG